MSKRTRSSTGTGRHILFLVSIFFFTMVASFLLFTVPSLHFRDEIDLVSAATTTPTASVHRGNYIVVHLDTMSLELRDGATLIETIPLLSQGKPGSYYETIGGDYVNDYKEPLHFSSIGHVYMPYSIHLFGNYFIHGIPYYTNGQPVASTYSGGCIRLTNENAKKVYDFVSRGTHIIVTRGNETAFDPTASSTDTLESMEMTNLMVASVSLEFLAQDAPITNTDGVSGTTRRSLLSRLIQEGDSSVATLYAKNMGTNAFVDAMNDKAQALGLTNTHFNDVTTPVITTYEDYERFMTYITTYKSYLRTLQ